MAQNVGINATGAAPNASAGLDVDFTNRGLLIPRVALTARNSNAPIGAGIATGLMVYNTATAGTAPNNVLPGFYWWNGSNWVAFGGTGGADWSLTGNAGTNPTNNFLGTTDNQSLVFRTFNTERMRILNTGRVGINTLAAPIGQLYVFGNFAAAINDYGSIMARNDNGSGTAINGTGQNGTDNGLVAGSGGSFSGVTTASYHYTTSAGVAQCATMQDAFGAQWLVGAWTGTTYRKIIGTGTVSTVIKDLNDEYVVMNCPETPENLFMDYGVGKLVNGKVHVKIDPILSKNIIVDEKHPLKVFIQLEGECNGVYVTNKTKEGFDVIELNGGTSNVEFSYSIVATMGDQTIKSPDGKTRTAKYDSRFEKAPPYKENLVHNKR
jgi:hypothetical protein